MPAPLPGTPRGIVELLRRYGVGLAGADVVVVGRGTTVGRPLGLLLTRRTENATVTTCHTGTRDLGSHCAGPTSSWPPPASPGCSRRIMVRPGAAVLDVGITRVVGEDGKVRWSVTCDPGFARWPVTWRRCRAGSAR